MPDLIVRSSNNKKMLSVGGQDMVSGSIYNVTWLC